ncbi:MAG: YncE family protein, partial [Bacteroidota bacterium]
MNRFQLLLLSFFLLLISSCKKDVSTTELQGYPDAVGEIIVKKCATAGCHNDASKAAAGGLSLETWDKLFQGGSGGSTVIPYRADQSWLCYFVNTYEDLGVKLSPTMPVNQTKLSHDEVVLLQNWVNEGAPSVTGKVAFSGDEGRNKYYITNQGCDIITVFDTKTKLAMRYVDVGIEPGIIEVPHDIKTSPDGKYLYVIFAAGSVIQKFSTVTDSLIGQIDITQGSWNTMTISADGKHAFIVDFNPNGRIAYVDLENLTLIKMYSAATLFVNPHGITATADFKTLYVTSQYGNYILKIDVTNPLLPDIQQIVIAAGETANNNNGTYDPHQVELSPDETKYFVTCQASNEVRVFQRSNDSLINIIPVGTFPLEMELSEKYNELFVTCEEDPTTSASFKGSVYVINYNSLQVVKVLQNNFSEPHGIGVDDKNNLLIIPSRNVSPNGPAPHHTSTCGGRNGYVQLVDLRTLEFIPNYKAEVSVDPYEVA